VVVDGEEDRDGIHPMRPDMIVVMDIPIIALITLPSHRPVEVGDKQELEDKERDGRIAILQSICLHTEETVVIVETLITVVQMAIVRRVIEEMPVIVEETGDSHHQEVQDVPLSKRMPRLRILRTIQSRVRFRIYNENYVIIWN